MKKKLIILGSAISVVGYMNAQTTLTALKTKMQGATNTIQNQRDGNFNQIPSLTLVIFNLLIFNKM